MDRAEEMQPRQESRRREAILGGSRRDCGSAPPERLSRPRIRSGDAPAASQPVSTPRDKRSFGMLSGQIVFTATLAAFIAIFWGVTGNEQSRASIARLTDTGAPSPFARFVPCGASGASNCVIDGSNFRINGRSIRLADAQTPAVAAPDCEREGEVGRRAQQRLATLLNVGPVVLSRSPMGDRDAAGVLLRIARIHGESIGAVLINEGLAYPRGDGVRSWCT